MYNYFHLQWITIMQIMRVKLECSSTKTVGNCWYCVNSVVYTNQLSCHTLWNVCVILCANGGISVLPLDLDCNSRHLGILFKNCNKQDWDLIRFNIPWFEQFIPIYLLELHCWVSRESHHHILLVSCFLACTNVQSNIVCHFLVNTSWFMTPWRWAFWKHFEHTRKFIIVI